MMFAILVLAVVFKVGIEFVLSKWSRRGGERGTGREGRPTHKLELCPESEILGVVSAEGVGGGGPDPSSGETDWTLIIPFSAWKPAGGGLRKSEMTVRKLVPKKELKTFMAAMNPYEVVRIKARWSEETDFGCAEALLTEFLGKDDSDPELSAYAGELHRPVTFSHPQFGLFTLDRRVNWFAAKAEWCGAPVELTVCSGAAEEMEKSLAAARQLWADQREWQKRIVALATKELRATKNNSWLDEDESEVSEEEFARRMVIQTISVQPSASFDFWYGDGDLFWGHSIMVSGTLTDGPKSAEIHG
jgi:hypothetical protein